MIDTEKIFAKLKEKDWLVVDGRGSKTFQATCGKYALRISSDGEYINAELGIPSWWANLFHTKEWVIIAQSFNWELMRKHIESLFPYLFRTDVGQLIK